MNNSTSISYILTNSKFSTLLSLSLEFACGVADKSKDGSLYRKNFLSKSEI